MATNTDIATQQENKEKILNISRQFNLSIDRVWKAWTEPASCEKWWGPKGFTCPYCSIDLKIGGKYLSCMRSAEGDEFWSTGVYKEIIPYKKLVYSDSFSDDKGNIIPASAYNMPGEWPMELLVTITFEETGEKTKMLLQHEGLPPEIYDDCEKGWQESFDKLEENLR